MDSLGGEQGIMASRDISDMLVLDFLTSTLHDTALIICNIRA